MKEDKEFEEGSTELNEDNLVKALDNLEALANKEPEVSKSDESGDNDDSFFQKAQEDSDEIKKGVEVSDFLSDITTQIGESIDSVNTLIKSEINGVTDSVREIAKAMKDIGESTVELIQRMNEIERTPIGSRKSVLTKGEKGISRFDSGTELSKAQVLNKLTSMFEKSENGVTADDVIGFEASGRMKPELKEIIYS